MGAIANGAVHCRVRILKPLNGVFSHYQPVVGGVYDALYNEKSDHKAKLHHTYICVIDVKDKKICLKRDEYEVLK